MEKVKMKKVKINKHADDVAKRNPMHRVHLILLCIFFCVYAFFIIFPYFWVLLSSFKDGQLEFITNPTGLPKKWMFSNYLEIFRLEDLNILTMFKNSMFFCIVCPTLSCLSCVLAGYVVAKYNFVGRKFIYTLYMLPIVISICGTQTSLYQLFDEDHMNLIGSYLSIVLLSLGGYGMNFLLFYSLFTNVSDTYMEAAEIDGAGYFTIFAKVMLPHCMGLVGTLWIMGFIGQWNDYATAKIFLGTDPAYATVATGVQTISIMVKETASTEDSPYGQNYPMLYATMIATAIPMIVVFALFQKQIMKLSIGGGIKE